MKSQVSKKLAAVSLSPLGESDTWDILRDNKIETFAETIFCDTLKDDKIATFCERNVIGTF